MVTFFKKGKDTFYAVESNVAFGQTDVEKLQWLFDGAKLLSSKQVRGIFIGPRREMITPWSTNAVEITQNMGIAGISRIEEFKRVSEDATFDRMLQRRYDGLDNNIFNIMRQPDAVEYIDDIHEYNLREGLALSADEEKYLINLAAKIGRPLTDSEVFGFSQVNSEHCRHKIFNGTFVIDGKEMPTSLFKLIKKTSQDNPNGLVSAYKDNVAFVNGPVVKQFAPDAADVPGTFEERDIRTVISLKAETHNFPTTVEPFNGAATGTGGEIRDRLGGGRASLPIAGTAVYMTSYPRLSAEAAPAETKAEARPWLYQTPAEILIKASNGASDFGNKFGQPLVCGSLLTFEHLENDRLYAYDKVIMLAGGVGFATRNQALKGSPKAGQKVVLLGGDNYRIGMGGGAVSSVNTGQYDNSIELNAVQRANPEMQKRVSNVIRALAESKNNPIVSIHDHGAGGHLNALSELVEETGGRIDISALPVGDPTLSAKEIVGNESQERMGFVVNARDIPYIERVAQRERAPMYVVGETTGDHRFVFEDKDGTRPIDLEMADMFGNSPKTVMKDETVVEHFGTPTLDKAPADYLRDVLALQSVACKDWLTNKVDRSVTGRIARQQCQGAIQLPLSDCAVVALDFHGRKGIATSIGHAPQVALADAAAGSVIAIAEALTNIVGADLHNGLNSVSLSANWMWPCNNPGQDAALYKAVKACSDFACALGINIPTGKDSLSMTQKYGDRRVLAPGTVIISAAGQVDNVRKTVSPVIVNKSNTTLLYIPFSDDTLRLGGSALYQSLGFVGSDAPNVSDPARFARVFNAVQALVAKRKLLAMHDVSAGGLLVTLLEMLFANVKGGAEVDTAEMQKILNTDAIHALYAENPAVVVQVEDFKLVSVLEILEQAGVKAIKLGTPTAGARTLSVDGTAFDIDTVRDAWFRPSFELDCLQSGTECAEKRFRNYGRQPLKFAFPKDMPRKLSDLGLDENRTTRSGVRAAIIREKGINGDREMAYSLHLAGFDVKDVHVSDLMSGRETLEDVNMIVFCGGFSNSDVLGSAKGWAGAFKYNANARTALERFYSRPDTLSLGVCNGCQLMVELDLIAPHHAKKVKMEHNDSHKFESQFVSVRVPHNNSVMFGNLEGLSTGIWVAHGEGKFNLPLSMDNYNVVLKYNYNEYPANPNGSRAAVAGICSDDGRHLAMMPHLERAIFPWQCAAFPRTRANDEITPWLQGFVNARRWIEANRK